MNKFSFYTKQEILNGLEKAMDETLDKNQLSSCNAAYLILALMYLVEKGE